MRTLGIDLAASPKKTAGVIIEWAATGARCTVIDGGDDEALIEAMSSVDFIGIDAPLGWPNRFIEAVTDYRVGKPWPDEDRTAFRFRLTDQVVREHVKSVIPLSVSSDLIAVTAMRCALLLSRWEAKSGSRVDRSGGGAIAEVYPAASLSMWEYRHRGYKGARNRQVLDPLVYEVTSDGGVDTSAISHWNDHIFDALVASLTVRARACGNTIGPNEQQLEQAMVEGWIHVPSLTDIKASLH